MDLMRNSDDSYKFFLSEKEDDLEILSGLFKQLLSEKQPTSSNVTLTNNMINCRKNLHSKSLLKRGLRKKLRYILE